MDHIYQTEPLFPKGILSPTALLTQTQFMNRTYGWMFFGLILTAGMSLAVASSASAIGFIFENQW